MNLEKRKKERPRKHIKMLKKQRVLTKLQLEMILMTHLLL